MPKGGPREGAGRPPLDRPPHKQVMYRIEEELADRFSAECVARGLLISETIERLMRNWLNSTRSNKGR